MNARGLTGVRAVKDRARGNRVAAVSARPVVENRPEHVDAAAVAAVVGQLSRSFVERAGACYLLRRQGEGRAKGVSRSAGLAGMAGKSGMPGCFGSSPP